MAGMDWYYLDRSGKEFGPFPTEKMHAWFAAGHFPIGEHLLVRTQDWPQHAPVREIFPDGEPFAGVVRPPRSAYPPPEPAPPQGVGPPPMRGPPPPATSLVPHGGPPPPQLPLPPAPTGGPYGPPLAAPPPLYGPPHIGPPLYGPPVGGPAPGYGYLPPMYPGMPPPGPYGFPSPGFPPVPGPFYDVLQGGSRPLSRSRSRTPQRGGRAGRRGGRRDGFKPHHSAGVPRATDLGARFSNNGKPSTTAMLRNIPNRYTQDQLLEEIGGEGFAGSYDFFYLPIDVRNSANVGYAFINFLDPKEFDRFCQNFSDYNFKRSGSKKVAAVSPAVVQGLRANIENLVKKRVAQGQYGPILMRGGQRIDFEQAAKELLAK